MCDRRRPIKKAANASSQSSPFSQPHRHSIFTMMIMRQRLLLLSVLLCALVGDAFQVVGRSSTWSFSSLLAVKEPQAVEKEVLMETTTAGEDSSTTTKTTTTRDLPPVLKSIADERREFQLNLGRAMDVLRKDYQEILTKRPDFSIYDTNIEAVDPSGVQLVGLDKYKSAFAFFQTFIRFWFSARSGIQFRMVYDFCHSSIRISWNAVLIPKVAGLRPLYVDGVSYYTMSTTSGKIVEHRIEKLVINNNGVVPPYGILSLLQQDALRLQGAGVPVGASLIGGGE